MRINVIIDNCHFEWEGMSRMSLMMGTDHMFCGSTRGNSIKNTGPEYSNIYAKWVAEIRLGFKLKLS